MDLSLRRAITVATTLVPAAVIRSSVRLAVHLSVTKWCCSPCCLYPCLRGVLWPLLWSSFIPWLFWPCAIAQLQDMYCFGKAVLLDKEAFCSRGRPGKSYLQSAEADPERANSTVLSADEIPYRWHMLSMRNLSSGSPLLPPAVKRLRADVVILQELFVETGFTWTQWMELLHLHTVYRSLQRSAFLFCLQT